MTYAESLAIEHIAWMRRTGRPWTEVFERAVIARVQSGLPPMPVTGGDDAVVALASAWIAMQSERLAV